MILESEIYIEGIRARDRTLLARTITLIESTHPEHQRVAQEVLQALLPQSGNAYRIGISGAPGVGKSTFIEALGSYAVTQGNQIAVLAVDPSSEQTKGSILGDKTRMRSLAHNPDAFIRPSPTAGVLGGVARTTRESVVLCEAFGFDVIMIETVGVGQSEIEVAEMVDFFLVLMTSGAGDEIQGLKKGLIEYADSLVIHKADTDIQAARRTARMYKNALALLNRSASVMTCSSVTEAGIPEVWEAIASHRPRERKRGSQSRRWLWATFAERVKTLYHERYPERIAEIEGAVIDGRLTPYQAVEELLALLPSE